MNTGTSEASQGEFDSSSTEPTADEEMAQLGAHTSVGHGAAEMKATVHEELQCNEEKLEGLKQTHSEMARQIDDIAMVVRK